MLSMGLSSRPDNSKENDQYKPLKISVRARTVIQCFLGKVKFDPIFEDVKIMKAVIFKSMLIMLTIVRFLVATRTYVSLMISCLTRASVD